MVNLNKIRVINRNFSSICRAFLKAISNLFFRMALLLLRFFLFGLLANKPLHLITSIYLMIVNPRVEILLNYSW